MEKWHKFSLTFLSAFLFICMFVSIVPQSGVAATETLEEKVDTYIEEHEETLAGLATVIFEDGNITTNVYGHTSIDQNLKVDKETVFEWGSSTKLLIWISVMQLVEDGRLDLEADISHYVPDDFHYPKVYEEPITLLHLMNHTAGFEESFTDLMVHDPDEIPSLRESLEQSDVEQQFRPGEVVAYSNYGAALAAFIVEEVSGVDYRKYVQENIFAPLEMNETAIDPAQKDHSWVKEQREKVQGYTTDHEVIFPNNYVIPLYPAGSAVGTVGDYGKVLRALLSDDGQLLFQEKETIQRMFEPTAYYPETNMPRIAHGLFSLYADGDVYGHSGNTIAFSASMYIDWKDKTGVAVMTNQANENTFTLGIPEVVFGQPTLDESSVGSLENASMWEGMYQPARSPYNGFSKVYGLLNRNSVTANNVNHIQMNGLTYKQQKPGIYVTEDDYSLYSLDTFSEHPTFGTVLSSAYSDLIFIPTYQHVLESALIIAGFIAGIFSISYFGLLFIEKISSQPMQEARRSKVTMIQHGLNILVIANIWWMTYQVLEMTTYEALRISFLLNIIYIIVTLGLSGYNVFYMFRRRQSVVSWLTIAAAIVISVNIVYWEFWR